MWKSHIAEVCESRLFDSTLHQTYSYMHHITSTYTSRQIGLVMYVRYCLDYIDEWMQLPGILLCCGPMTFNALICMPTHSRIKSNTTKWVRLAFTVLRSLYFISIIMKYCLREKRQRFIFNLRSRVWEEKQTRHHFINTSFIVWFCL